MGSIAVVGGQGYIGQRLVMELRGRGHEVAAIGATTRPPRRRSDAVVNLAHPNRGPVYTWPAQNRRILRTITGLSGPETRLVAVGTLAVFGDALERPPRPEPVPPRPDFPYVERKLELEAWLLGRFRDVQIVRLGNVWGPGSPAWTQRLASHLRAGAPVGVRGHDGFSNTTDVGNVASYLAFVAESRTLHGHGFHHLAELGELRWSHLVGVMSEALGVEPVLVDEIPVKPPPPRRSRLSRGARSLVRASVAALHAGAVALGGPTLAGRRLAWPPAGTDPAFLRILSCPRLFPCHLAQGWRPAISPEASFAAVREWLSTACPRGPGSCSPRSLSE